VLPVCRMAWAKAFCSCRSLTLYCARSRCFSTSCFL